MKKNLLSLSCLLATTLYAAPYPRLDPNSLINGCLLYTSPSPRD